MIARFDTFASLLRQAKWHFARSLVLYLAKGKFLARVDPRWILHDEADARACDCIGKKCAIVGSARDEARKGEINNVVK